ncbi:hypothetical protein J3L18_05285 [Mucilaginibacter gossypii]|uniref:hypothetical protein n=1 Tax=Mucilaginibacter gossypii TaxID=551996 RepID=UPI000DCB8F03|nr:MULTISPECIES: hypothetical protein [Mucilaginibacter]QTE38491.1 hypothetical protein J3L18_05285 [Mucilaginibacter gossypii]RAV55772.1 hypothetical protein DIU36_16910 [Mucilaginibacter rubeus]
MTTYKTITGREINVKANHSARTFTIRTESGKYRTTKMNKEEFNENLNNTGNDWQNFLKLTNDYYPA